MLTLRIFFPISLSVPSHSTISAEEGKGTKELPKPSMQKNINFEDLQKELIETGGYIGTREPFRTNVDWAAQGCENILVSKDSLEEGAPIELELVIVAEINPAHFFMTSDGSYTPISFGGAPVKPFANTKASCILMAPRVEPWKTDFIHALTALRRLEDQKSTEGTKRLGLFWDELRSMPRLVHKLFIKRDDLSAEEIENVASITDTSLTIEHWPVSTANQALLDDIKQTHVVSMIPAKNIDGTLIPPDLYRQKLSGALVECHFSLSHWFIRSRSVDAFNANLRWLRVLKTPLPPPISPNKKRIYTSLGSEEVSSKTIRQD